MDSLRNAVARVDFILPAEEDYLPKSFSIRGLGERIEACAKRSNSGCLEIALWVSGNCAGNCGVSGNCETVEQRVDLAAQLEKTAVGASERDAGRFEAFGDGHVVGAGTVQHDKRFFLDLLRDQADQVFADNPY